MTNTNPLNKTLEPRLPLAVKVDLAEAARQQGIGVSAFVRRLLSDWLETAQPTACFYRPAGNVLVRLRTSHEQRTTLRHVGKAYGIHLGQIVAGALYLHIKRAQPEFAGWAGIDARPLT